MIVCPTCCQSQNNIHQNFIHQKTEHELVKCPICQTHCAAHVRDFYKHINMCKADTTPLVKCSMCDASIRFDYSDTHMRREHSIFACKVNLYFSYLHALRSNMHHAAKNLRNYQKPGRNRDG